MCGRVLFEEQLLFEALFRIAKAVLPKKYRYSTMGMGMETITRLQDRYHIVMFNFNLICLLSLMRCVQIRDQRLLRSLIRYHPVDRLTKIMTANCL